jgi:pimeloyl-ACP methyl ester carboxylesterase
MKRTLTSAGIAFLSLIGMVFFQACSKTGHGSTVEKTFVLVHGAWQAPWVWDQVKERLEKTGQRVIIVALPAHGDDHTSPAKVTLDIYRDVVINAINAANAKRSGKSKVILVGHSMAGMVISEVAESIPEQIEKMVYIGAYLPVNNQSLLDLANTDAQSYLGTELMMSPDKLTLGIATENITKTFCQDGSDAIKQQLLARYRPEPTIPFTDSAHLSTAFKSTHKYYIHTLQDHVVGPDLQNRMIAASNILKVYPINSSHCPFLSKPDEVTEILLDIINH